MSGFRLIYLAGLDGSGKTSQAERFVREASASGAPWVYRWVRWEPFITRPLMAGARWLLGRGSGRGTARPADEPGYVEFTAGKQQVFRRAWMRGLWSSIVLIEFWFQAWWRLGGAVMRRRWILVDRYLPDLWVDLAMNFGEGSDGVRRASRHPLCRLFPRIERMVYLDVDPELGFQRKSDGTPLAYLQDRAPLYASLASILVCKSVDANRGFDEVAKDLGEFLRDANPPKL